MEIDARARAAERAAEARTRAARAAVETARILGRIATPSAREALWATAARYVAVAKADHIAILGLANETLAEAEAAARHAEAAARYAEALPEIAARYLDGERLRVC